MLDVMSNIHGYGLFDTHDGVIEWKHFPPCWPFVRGIHRSPVDSPHKGQWRGALMFSMICAWTNDWTNNGDAGDLGRHCNLIRACDICNISTHSYCVSGCILWWYSIKWVTLSIIDLSFSYLYTTCRTGLLHGYRGLQYTFITYILITTSSPARTRSLQHVFLDTDIFVMMLSNCSNYYLVWNAVAFHGTWIGLPFHLRFLKHIKPWKIGQV